MTYILNFTSHLTLKHAIIYMTAELRTGEGSYCNILGYGNI
jgi:hypothetical protein